MNTADIEKSFREFVANRFEFIALAHGRRHNGDSIIAAHLAENRVAGKVRKRGFAGSIEYLRCSFLILERGRRVKVNRISGSGLIAVAFLGDDVQQDRATLLLGHLQILICLFEVIENERCRTH